MKTSLLLAAVFASCAWAAGSDRFPWNVHLDYGLLVDGRDGRHYKTIEIDSLEWLAENVKFVTDSSWCYDHDTTNCNIYGRLYRGSQAEKACPKGWHLPSADEWRSLLHSAGDGHAVTRLTASRGWPTPSLVEATGIALSKWIKPIPRRQSRKMSERLAQAAAQARADAAKLPPFKPDPRSDDRFGFRLLPAGLRVVPKPHYSQPTAGFGEAAYGESSNGKSNPTIGREFGRLDSYTYLWSVTALDTALSIDGSDEMGISIMSSQGSMDPFGFSVRCVDKIGR